MRKKIITYFLLLLSLSVTAQTKRALVIGLGEQQDKAWNKINGDKDVPFVQAMLKNAGVAVERVEGINIVGDNVEQSAVFIGRNLFLHTNGTPHQSHNILKLVVAVELELLVDGIAFDEVLLENRVSPLTETGALY